MYMYVHYNTKKGELEMLNMRGCEGTECRQWAWVMRKDTKLNVLLDSVMEMLVCVVDISNIWNIFDAESIKFNVKLSTSISNTSSSCIFVLWVCIVSIRKQAALHPQVIHLYEQVRRARLDAAWPFPLLFRLMPPRKEVLLCALVSSIEFVWLP